MFAAQSLSLAVQKGPTGQADPAVPDLVPARLASVDFMILKDTRLLGINIHSRNDEVSCRRLGRASRDRALGNPHISPFPS